MCRRRKEHNNKMQKRVHVDGQTQWLQRCQVLITGENNGTCSICKLKYSFVIMSGSMRDMRDTRICFKCIEQFSLKRFESLKYYEKEMDLKLKKIREEIVSLQAQEAFIEESKKKLQMVHTANESSATIVTNATAPSSKRRKFQSEPEPISGPCCLFINGQSHCALKMFHHCEGCDKNCEFVLSISRNADLCLNCIRKMFDESPLSATESAELIQKENASFIEQTERLKQQHETNLQKITLVRASVE